MVFALETYWPSADGWGAARIEEEVVVTADGCEVITKFPAEELMIAGSSRYITVNGPLPGIRDAQSHLNTADRKSTRLNSSHVAISYAVFCLKKKTKMSIRLYY